MPLAIEDVIPAVRESRKRRRANTPSSEDAASEASSASPASVREPAVLEKDGTQKMKEKALLIQEEIHRRLQSEETIAIISFVDSAGSKIETIPHPDIANLLKIGKYFPSMPIQVQAAFSRHMPEHIREASNSLIRLLNSTASKNRIDNPPMLENAQPPISETTSKKE